MLFVTNSWLVNAE